MSATACVVCGELACVCTRLEPLLLVVQGQREHAGSAMLRWLAEVERQAPIHWDTGCSGYLGTFKLTAHVEDDGIRLHVERSIEEPIG